MHRDRAVPGRLQPGPRAVDLPRPGVAEPRRGQHVQGIRIRAGVGHLDRHQHVARIGLGVVHLDDPVPVAVEGSGVQQLVLRIEFAAAPVLPAQILIRKGGLRIVVAPAVPGVAGHGVEVPPVVLDVLAVVGLAAGQPEDALLEDRVAPVPQGQTQAQPLLDVREPGESVLPPPVRPGPGVIVREIRPCLPVGAVVLAHGAPLPLAEVRPPEVPVARLRAARPRASRTRSPVPAQPPPSSSIRDTPTRRLGEARYGPGGRPSPGTGEQAMTPMNISCPGAERPTARPSWWPDPTSVGGAGGAAGAATRRCGRRDRRRAADPGLPGQPLPCGGDEQGGAIGAAERAGVRGRDQRSLRSSASRTAWLGSNGACGGRGRGRRTGHTAEAARDPRQPGRCPPLQTGRRGLMVADNGDRLCQRVGHVASRTSVGPVIRVDGLCRVNRCGAGQEFRIRPFCCSNSASLSTPWP